MSLRALPLAILVACTAPVTDADPDTDLLVEPSPACRAGANVEYVIELVGDGFADRDGIRVHATTNIELSEPAALGTLCQTSRATTIEGGRFAVTLANLTDTAVYPFIGVFLDLDGDGRCTADEPTWGIYGVIVESTQRIVLEASELSFDDPREVCGQFSAAER
jgi:hypothetical protein